MTKLVRPIPPNDRLHSLLEDYRRARNEATAVRREHARVELDGRYHLDGVVPHAVREHRSFHDEKHAALALADSLLHWVDAHESARVYKQ